MKTGLGLGSKLLQYATPANVVMHLYCQAMLARLEVVLAVGARSSYYSFCTLASLQGRT